MEKNKLSNVFHFENDMMVYMDLEKNLPKFIENYEEFAITMHFDESCVPGFMFIKDQNAMNRLVEFMMRNNFRTDMDLLANFKAHSPKTKILPVVYPDYIKNNMFSGSYESGVRPANASSIYFIKNNTFFIKKYPLFYKKLFYKKEVK